MKIIKMILFLCLILPLQMASAETQEQIVVINSGKAGGSFNARTQMYKEGLIANGYDVVFENIGKISQAVEVFKKSTKPTIMVYANNQVYKQDLFHTEQNFIMLEYQQPLYVCKTNASKDKTGVLTVAHGKGYDPKLLTNLLGSEVVLVPYKNSGAMLKGILGGDVDMMVNNQGKSFKYMASGEGSCEPSDVLPIICPECLDVVSSQMNNLRSLITQCSLLEQIHIGNLSHYHEMNLRQVSF